MPQTERYEVLIIGSREAEKYMAWTMRRRAMTVLL
jgi:hypothetical protein